MLEIPVNKIKANTWNCNVLSEEENQTLKQQLQKEGQKNTPPIFVRKIDNTYEIIDGEHRWQIAKELNWPTINAIDIQVTDLQSKNLCINYNRWRGHLNWIKLYELIQQDQNNGMNIQEAYKDTLSQKDIDYLLTLNKLTPNSKKTLETYIIKHPEITLEQLYLIALIPPVMQQDLLEQIKPPIVTKVLLQILNAIQQKNTTIQQSNQQITQQQHLPNQTLGSNTDFLTNQDTNQTPPLQQHVFNEDKHAHALLLAVSYCCDCGQPYKVHFKSMTIKKQKPNQVLEHVDVEPHILHVHCNKCGHNIEITLEDAKKEVVSFSCVNCRPMPRKGKLDVTTGEATWLD